jgi:peptide/nickel transport system substrate-binding protein
MGHAPDMLRTLPGYDPDVQKNRAEARRLMEALGYGPDHRLKVKTVTRNLPDFRDNAVILIDQLKEIYIDGELDLIDTVHWFPTMYRKDYLVGYSFSAGVADDPDDQFYSVYACEAPLNYGGYCNAELEKQFEQQSMEADQEKRKKMAWEIDRKLQEDVARPIIAHYRAATCWQPRVKGLTTMVSSIFNGWRMEDVWLDK